MIRCRAQFFLTAFFFIAGIFSGCASTNASAPLLSGQETQDGPICFTLQSEIPPLVQHFLASRDMTDEEGKIDYLIERVRISNIIFIRNGKEYSSEDAAKFLRWKLNRWRFFHKMKVETAQDFITKIASDSTQSGDPYWVRLQNGQKYLLKEILKNELDQLEMCLTSTALRDENTPAS